MTQIIGCTTTPSCVSLTTDDGRNLPITSSHPNYEAIRVAALTRNLVAIVPLLDVAETVNRIAVEQSAGTVFVRDGQVIYTGNGEEEVLRNSAAMALLAIIREANEAGVEPNILPMLRFIENLMNNPSHRSVEQLWGFIDATKLSLTEDGCFLGYKKVRRLSAAKSGYLNGSKVELVEGDFVDCYTSTFRNNVGDEQRISRNKVDEDPERTCSTGLHVCSESYLPHYGTGSYDTCVIVKVNPADVVAIPTDYHNAKMRVCAYTVLGERKGDVHRDTRDDLTRTVYTETDLDEAFDGRTGNVVADESVSKDEAIQILDLTLAADPMGALRKRLNRGVSCTRVYVDGEERVLILNPDAAV